MHVSFDPTIDFLSQVSDIFTMLNAKFPGWDTSNRRWMLHPPALPTIANTFDREFYFRYGYFPELLRFVEATGSDGNSRFRFQEFIPVPSRPLKLRPGHEQYTTGAITIASEEAGRTTTVGQTMVYRGQVFGDTAIVHPSAQTVILAGARDESSRPKDDFPSGM